MGPSPKAFGNTQPSSHCATGTQGDFLKIPNMSTGPPNVGNLHCSIAIFPHPPKPLVAQKIDMTHTLLFEVVVVSFSRTKWCMFLNK